MIDHVLPQAPVRQWVMSVPFSIRYLLAYDAKLCSKVLKIFVREVARWYRFKARAELALDSVRDAKCGCVTFTQRFDSGLRLNVHFHMIALDQPSPRLPPPPRLRRDTTGCQAGCT